MKLFLHVLLNYMFFKCGIELVRVKLASLNPIFIKSIEVSKSQFNSPPVSSDNNGQIGLR